MERHMEFLDRNELRVIEAIFDGEAQQYHELIRPYERRIYKMALALMQNELDAEYVAQQVFLEALHNLSAVRGQTRFGTWLISITLNEARSRLWPKATVRIELLKEIAAEEEQLSPALLQDWYKIPSVELERPEIRAMLQQAICGLCHQDCEVLLLRDMEHFSLEETAVALKISSAAAKIRLHRARMTMQRGLAPTLMSTRALKPVEQPTSRLIEPEC